MLEGWGSGILSVSYHLIVRTAEATRLILRTRNVSIVHLVLARVINHRKSFGIQTRQFWRINLCSTSITRIVSIICNSEMRQKSRSVISASVPNVATQIPQQMCDCESSLSYI